MQKIIANYLIERANRELPAEVLERIESLPVNSRDGSGFDDFGFNPEYLKISAPAALFLYRKWFRTETFGVMNIPAEGPALIIANHSGQIPLDGMMIAIACLMELDKPRLPRAMVEKWFPTLPHVSILFARAGQVVGVMENAEKLLADGELVLIFPEGIKGSGKTWDKRYKLQRFTVGFMELAIKYKAPVIPTAVIGGEEQAPSFYDVKEIARLINFPYFPITPTFPWLGLLGLIPYPSRYHVYFGEKLDFSVHQNDLSDPERIRLHVERVKTTIQDMIDEGLKERIFPGL